MRIVSLLPSATEILHVLGLERQLVGVTHECDFPAGVRSLPKVTRPLIPTDGSSNEIDRLVRERLQVSTALYSLDLPVLHKLRPDLIVTQALCDVCAVAEAEVKAAACTLPGAPQVVSLEPQTLTEVFESIRTVAAAVGADGAADAAISRLAARVDAVTGRTELVRKRPRVAFLEWLDPPFSSGHWSPELVRMAGGIDGLGGEGKHSRTLCREDVVNWQPEVVFIACCGFGVERTFADLPLLQEITGWQEIPAVQSGRVYVTDGSCYFNRPGPRLVDSLEILAHALHAELHPLPDGLPAAVRVDTMASVNSGAALPT